MITLVFSRNGVPTHRTQSPISVTYERSINSADSLVVELRSEGQGIAIFDSVTVWDSDQTWNTQLNAFVASDQLIGEFVITAVEESFTNARSTKITAWPVAVQYLSNTAIPDTKFINDIGLSASLLRITDLSAIAMLTLTQSHSRL